MAAETPLTGGCLCGGVRFELSAAPRLAGYCHCTRCQQRTGTSASAQVFIDADAVRMSAFDRDPGVRPSFRAFVAYAASWEPIPDDGLERFDEARPG